MKARSYRGKVSVGLVMLGVALAMSSAYSADSPLAVPFPAATPHKNTEPEKPAAVGASSGLAASQGFAAARSAVAAKQVRLEAVLLELRQALRELRALEAAAATKGEAPAASEAKKHLEKRIVRLKRKRTKLRKSIRHFEQRERARERKSRVKALQDRWDASVIRSVNFQRELKLNARRIAALRRMTELAAQARKPKWERRIKRLMAEESTRSERALLEVGKKP